MAEEILDAIEDADTVCTADVKSGITADERLLAVLPGIESIEGVTDEEVCLHGSLQFAALSKTNKTIVTPMKGMEAQRVKQTVGDCRQSSLASKGKSVETSFHFFVSTRFVESLLRQQDPNKALSSAAMGLVCSLIVEAWGKFAAELAADAQ